MDAEAESLAWIFRANVRMRATHRRPRFMPTVLLLAHQLLEEKEKC